MERRLCAMRDILSRILGPGTRFMAILWAGYGALPELAKLFLPPETIQALVIAAVNYPRPAWHWWWIGLLLILLIGSLYGGYTEIRALRSTLDERTRLNGALNGLSSFVVEGQRIEGWLGGIPDPSLMQRDWFQRAEAFIDKELGLYYVAMFRNSAGLTEPPTTGFTTEAQRFCYVDTEWRLQRLHEIMTAVHNEKMAIAYLMLKPSALRRALPQPEQGA